MKAGECLSLIISPDFSEVLFILSFHKEHTGD